MCNVIFDVASVILRRRGAVQKSMDTKDPLIRDAETMIKIIFERSSQKGGRQGGSKRGSTGDPSWNFIVGLNHRKNSILESRIFIVVAFCQEMQWQ